MCRLLLTLAFIQGRIFRLLSGQAGSSIDRSHSGRLRCSVVKEQQKVILQTNPLAVNTIKKSPWSFGFLGDKLQSFAVSCNSLKYLYNLPPPMFLFIKANSSNVYNQF
jgi:hypothetical protein